MRRTRSRVAGGALCLAIALGCGEEAASSPEVEARDGAVDAAPPAPDRGPLPDVAPAPDAGPPDMAVDAWVPDLGPPRDAAPQPLAVHAVKTRIGAPATVVGVANKVTCVALGPTGEAIDGVELTFEVRPAQGWSTDEADPSSLVGTRAGDYRVACSAPALGLRDGSPVRWDVLPGPPADVRAIVEPAVIVAGGSAAVRCLAEDAYGNPVEAEDAAVAITPPIAGNEVLERSIAATRAGHYRVDCVLAGAQSLVGASLFVEPDLPARVVAAVQPDRPVHDVGAVITYAARLVDRFDNVVTGADLAWGSAPALPTFGEGRYLPESEGRYTLSVQVVSATFEDQPVLATAEVLVDAGGPTVGCTRPPEGAMIGRDGPLSLEGQVADIAGIQSFTVDGRDVAIGEDGSFAIEVQPAWGLNVHQLTARDEVGNVNSTFCSYFAAEAYHPEDTPLLDSILLNLQQAAVDDGPPADPLASITDLLRRVVESPALVDTIDASLRAQNPVVPNECRQSLPLVGCIFRLGAEYRGMRITGARTVAVALVDGGLRAQVRINGIELDVRLLGTVGNSGTITAEYIAADLSFNIGLANGRPVVGLRETHSVTVGRLDSDFDGVISGTLLDLVFGAFESTIRNEVTSAMRGFLEQQVDALLSGLLDGLDLASIGVAFDLPGFAGNPETELALGLGFSSVNVNPARLRLGLSTQVQGPSRQGAQSAGVALPPGAVLIDPRPQGTMGAAISLGVVNQMVHRMWRAGVFEIGDAGALLGDLPDGAAISLRVLVPPAVRGADDGQEVVLHLGPAVGEFFYPGLFDTPLRLRLAAFASAAVTLEGDTLRFGGAEGVQITALHVAIEGASLSPQARATLERDLRQVLQSIIDGALNGALPALPIPDFALPDSLAEFGIPQGTRLGLREPVLQGQPSHVLLDGRFGQ